MRRDFPAPLLDGKILLVPAHHGNKDLVRQREERRIEITFEHTRTFVEIGNELLKFRVLVDSIPCPLCMRRQLFRDLLSTLCSPNDHAISFELLFVVREVFYRERAFPEKPVAEGCVSCRDARERKLQRL